MRLGWIITTNLGNGIIWHNGGAIGGYNAIMVFNPDTNRGIVVLCSTGVADVDFNPWIV
jgi:serine-type D-Ala-D-Ala carboxypeptidase/endopeptidase